jgi:hypothetical protein
MPRASLIDELHLTLYAPRGLPERAYAAMRRTLTGPGFRDRLGRAVRDAVRHYPSPARVRVTVGRWPPAPSRRPEPSREPCKPLHPV